MGQNTRTRPNLFGPLQPQNVEDPASAFGRASNFINQFDPFNLFAQRLQEQSQAAEEQSASVPTPSQEEWEQMSAFEKGDWLRRVGMPHLPAFGTGGMARPQFPTGIARNPGAQNAFLRNPSNAASAAPSGAGQGAAESAGIAQAGGQDLGFSDIAMMALQGGADLLSQNPQAMRDPFGMTRPLLEEAVQRVFGGGEEAETQGRSMEEILAGLEERFGDQSQGLPGGVNIQSLMSQGPQTAEMQLGSPPPQAPSFDQNLPEAPDAAPIMQAFEQARPEGPSLQTFLTGAASGAQGAQTLGDVLLGAGAGGGQAQQAAQGRLNAFQRQGAQLQNELAQRAFQDEMRLREAEQQNRLRNFKSELQNWKQRNNIQCGADGCTVTQTDDQGNVKIKRFSPNDLSDVVDMVQAQADLQEAMGDGGMPPETGGVLAIVAGHIAEGRLPAPEVRSQALLRWAQKRDPNIKNMEDLRSSPAVQTRLEKMSEEELNKAIKGEMIPILVNNPDTLESFLGE